MATGAHLDDAMAALADGDRAAFDTVYTALWPMCRGFARRLLGDDALGDDAAQAALEKLFFQAPRYRRGKPVAAWALTLTAFEARTLMKRRARRAEAALDEHASPAAPPDEIAVTRDLLSRALDVVDNLGARDRQAVLDAIGERAAPLDDARRKQRQRALARLRELWSTLYD